MSINYDITNEIRTFLSTCREWKKPNRTKFETALSKMLDIFKYLDINMAQKTVDLVGEEMQEMNIFESLETWNNFLDNIESRFSNEGYLEDSPETEIESTTSLEINIVETPKKEQKHIEKPFLETIIKIGTKESIYVDRVYTMSVKSRNKKFLLYTNTKQELANILNLIEGLMRHRKKAKMDLVLGENVEMRVSSMIVYYMVKEDGFDVITTELPKIDSNVSETYQYVAMKFEIRYKKKVDKKSKYFLPVLESIEIIEKSIKNAKKQLTDLK